MKRRLRRIYSLLVMIGIDPVKMFYFLWGLPVFLRELIVLMRQKRTAVKEFPLGDFFPCLEDRYTKSGSARGHYFHQDLLVARRVHLNNPSTHVDVGSRVDGFVAHVASFRPIEVIDIRPLSNTIPNIKYMQADLMAKINTELVGYCDSLSCLHALEHFGLGRYGDPVNYDGYILGLNNLWSILKKGGKFYFSVPIGPQRIEFNAHRVFSVSYLLECFEGKFNIDHFSYVDDEGELLEDVQLAENQISTNYDCIYGCGIFEMTKI
ncbi:MAG: DUF268 domain-containing protein [Bacteroidetes bacterium]|nr:DUF268 domain-containing protein [Bacteroidota bacterium]